MVCTKVSFIFDESCSHYASNPILINICNIQPNPYLLSMTANVVKEE